MKETTYQQKFQTLETWMPSLIHAIKKDLRQEHLKNDVAFVRQHFQTKNPAKITAEEMIEVYPKLVVEGNEALGEFMATRWLIKQGDLYQYFEGELSKINPNFAELKSIDQPVAQKMMQSAVSQFGATNTYLFSLLNSVVFPDSVYQELDLLARQETADNAEKSASDAKLQAAAKEQLDLTQTLARLTDKYEKKLQGLEKKYLQDTEALRRQVASLQRQLAEHKKGSAAC